MYKINFTENDDVVFTSYFCSKENPQPDASGNHSTSPINNIAYIYPWYASVCHLKLNGIIIHDGLSSEFINEYTTEKIKFIYHSPANYSLNDERFIALARILNANKIRKVMITDGSDLLIKKNPFIFINEHQKLYCGSDEPSTPKIIDNSWCLNKLTLFASIQRKEIEINQNFLNFEYVNAGVLGGSYEMMKCFSNLMSTLFEILDSNQNNNMMALNYLIWKYNIPYFKGTPLTSPFKKYEMHGDYFLIHK